MVGVLLLAKGWIGFNGGGYREFNESVPGLLANTVLSGTAGLVASLVISLIIKGRSEIRWAMNGTLVGLVGITACCHVVGSREAVLIGVISVIIMLAIETILHQFKIDDAVGAVPVHLGGGIWGTLAVAVFGNPERLSTGLSRLEQLYVQIMGIGSCFVWAFGVGFILLKAINRLFPLRVSREDEHIGLNVSEHGASTEILDLFKAMDQQAKTRDLSLRVHEEPFTEVGQIASRYNQVMETLDHALTRIKSIVETARDGIITFSKDTYRISTLNPAAQVIFGYPDQTLLTKPITEIVTLTPTSSSREESQKIKNKISEIFLTKGYQEIKGRRADNTIFPLEVAITEAQFGKEEYYIGTFHDITQRKKTEEELQQAHQSQQRHHERLQLQHQKLKETQAQLVQAEKIAGLGTLVAGIAHEINNPNNFIYLSSRNLKIDLEKLKNFIFELASDEVDEEIRLAFENKFNRLFVSLADICEGSTRVQTIVDDLRTFSRQDKGKMTLINIIEGLESTRRLVHAQYGKQVEINCDFRTSLKIECYPTQLNQVFMNIMTNACQAVIAKTEQPQKQNAKTVSICTFVESSHLGIGFQDTGCGMTDEVKKRMFDPFFTTKPVGEGTGLGMSIAIGIVRNHKGTITVDSIPGQGTTVTVLLPSKSPSEKVI